MGLGDAAEQCRFPLEREAAKAKARAAPASRAKARGKARAERDAAREAPEAASAGGPRTAAGQETLRRVENLLRPQAASESEASSEDANETGKDLAAATAGERADGERQLTWTDAEKAQLFAMVQVRAARAHTIHAPLYAPDREHIKDPRFSITMVLNLGVARVICCRSGA
jgi:hypothetical protein